MGLTLGFLTWQVGFMSIGGEWFGMWMSKQWNGVPDAFRFFVTIILVLIYLVQRDGGGRVMKMARRQGACDRRIISLRPASRATV